MPDLHQYMIVAFHSDNLERDWNGPLPCRVAEVTREDETGVEFTRLTRYYDESRWHYDAHQNHTDGFQKRTGSRQPNPMFPQCLDPDCDLARQLEAADLAAPPLTYRYYTTSRATADTPGQPIDYTTGRPVDYTTGPTDEDLACYHIEKIGTHVYDEPAPIPGTTGTLAYSAIDYDQPLPRRMAEWCHLTPAPEGTRGALAPSFDRAVLLDDPSRQARYDQITADPNPTLDDLAYIIDSTPLDSPDPALAANCRHAWLYAAATGQEHALQRLRAHRANLRYGWDDPADVILPMEHDTPQPEATLCADAAATANQNPLIGVHTTTAQPAGFDPAKHTAAPTNRPVHGM